MTRRLLLALLFWVPVLGVAQPQGLPDFTELVEKLGPSVVNISTTQSVKGNPPQESGKEGEEDPFLDFFRRFGPQQQPRDYETRSLGSGFILSSDGFILTNSHVVDAADEVTVRLLDKREFKARVIGNDKRSDVALIKIEATGLPAVTLGEPARLKVGEWVIAIGSPFGFDNSVTAGIVSAKGRSLPQENFVPFIQTDVAINPGNSGGPLFNMKGEVVGINSMIFSRTGGYMGLSFAIPIDVARDVADQLQSNGRVTRGRIGVVIQEVTKELAESFGLATPAGALVTSVEASGPAGKAGILASDVILRFDNREVPNSIELPRIVAATKPGAKVNVQVWRKGEAKELALTVGEIPDETAGKRAMPKRSQAGEVLSRLGLGVIDLGPEQRKALNISGGALVESAEGTVAKGGIRRGDVILAVGNQEVKSADALNGLLASDKPRTVALLIRRGEGSLYIPLKIGGR